MSRYKVFVSCIIFLLYSCGDEGSNNSVANAPDEIASSEEHELLSSSNNVDSIKTRSSSSVKLDKSSSSEKPSSSSVIETSSSSLVTTGVCKTELEDRCTYGSLYDERDGQTYKTVKIGEQW